MASTVWKGHVTFGLVSFPVKLFTAARSETISFNQLHRDDHSRVKQVLYCQAEDKPIARTDLVKGYEYEKGRWVVVEDEEIKRMAPPSARTMEIVEFVKSSEVDPVYFESSYYMAPDEAGERPYALLHEALERTGYTGVAKITMHNREHIALFRPGPKGLMMHTMYYADEVRATEEFRTDKTLVKEKELALATMLIESLSAEFQPEKYRDTYRDNLRAMIEAKIEGKEVVAPPEPETARVIDIMEALKQSLAVAKKPASTAMEADSQTVEMPKRARTPKRKAVG